jgi:hypothetical protein
LGRREVEKASRLAVEPVMLCIGGDADDFVRNRVDAAADAEAFANGGGERPGVPGPCPYA